MIEAVAPHHDRPEALFYLKKMNGMKKNQNLINAIKSVEEFLDYLVY